MSDREMAPTPWGDNIPDSPFDNMDTWELIYAISRIINRSEEESAKIANHWTKQCRLVVNDDEIRAKYLVNREAIRELVMKCVRNIRKNKERGQWN